LKAQIAERFNRTIKEKLWKSFSPNNTKRWIDILVVRVYKIEKGQKTGKDNSVYNMNGT
jgi:hypothetical protein